jgi:hypothetical protein
LKFRKEGRSERTLASVEVQEGRKIGMDFYLGLGFGSDPGRLENQKGLKLRF